MGSAAWELLVIYSSLWTPKSWSQSSQRYCRSSVEIIQVLSELGDQEALPQTRSSYRIVKDIIETIGVLCTTLTTWIRKNKCRN